MRTSIIAAGIALTLGLSACGSSSVPNMGASGAAATDPTNTEAAAALGLPPNGPDFLYSPPPDLPQLQNRDPRFTASPLMVSGTERYINGEYEYTDFIYDDEDATYPDNGDPSSPLWPTYGGNAADLFEFRISTHDPNNLAVRFTLNTLLVPNSTIITVAFDSDNNPNTGSSTLPRDPGMPFPGTDQVLTTWGTGAEWSKWNGKSWDTVPLQVSTDLDANQITVTVPKSVAYPTGQWKATLATGLYDTSSGGWLSLGAATCEGSVCVPVSASGTPKIINLGFRFNELQPVASEPLDGLVSLGSMGLTFPLPGGPTGAPYQQQAAALAANNPTQFANLIDFDLLRNGGARDNVPTGGMMFRIFASKLKTVFATQPNSSGDLEPSNALALGEGKDTNTLASSFMGPLQPYALYVPPGYDPRRPAPFTFFLKCDGCSYWDLDDPGTGTLSLIGDARNSLVVMPESRGPHGFCVGDQEYDLLEAWTDVARHFNLDPTRPAVSGGSGGGYCAYRLALLYPHLFSRVMPIVPASCRGMWLIATCTGGDETVLANWTESARNVPIFHMADALSELTFYPGALQLVMGLPINGQNSFDSLGYRYKFWSMVSDHLLAAFINTSDMTSFLGQYQIEQRPFHVTYSRMPSSDLADIGLVHNRAYWLSGIEVRDASATLAKGVIDAVSLGFGESDPTSSQSVSAGLISSTVPLPYVETQRTWGDPSAVPVEDRIEIKATNIGTVTIDPVAAHVDCNVKLDINSDGPLSVTLLGCPK